MPSRLRLVLLEQRPDETRRMYTGSQVWRWIGWYTTWKEIQEAHLAYSNLPTRRLLSWREFALTQPGGLAHAATANARAQGNFVQLQVYREKRRCDGPDSRYFATCARARVWAGPREDDRLPPQQPVVTQQPFQWPAILEQFVRPQNR